MEAAILQAYYTALDASRAEERAAIANPSRPGAKGDTTSQTPTPSPSSSTGFYTASSAATSASAAANAMSRTSDAATASMDAGPERPKKKSKLTSYVPDPGYFLAGAVAGGVSRTATAPLDRLKVYLLVKTQSSADTALKALKQGRPIVALRNAVKPIADGVQDLWRAGGMRSMFAGEFLHRS